MFAAGRAGVLCVFLDAGILGADRGILQSDAVALVGTVLRLDRELQLRPHGPRLRLALEDDGSGALEALRALSKREFTLVSKAADMRWACGCDALQIWISRESRDAAAGGLWILNDAYRGLADIDDADRRFREMLGVPVPRPLPPGMISGELIQIPSDVDRSVLLRAVFDVYRTSWTIIDRRVVLYSEDSDQIDWLLRMAGAVRLSRAVHLTRVRLVDVPDKDAIPLLQLTGRQLIEAGSEDAAGLGWRQLRFAVL